MMNLCENCETELTKLCHEYVCTTCGLVSTEQIFEIPFDMCENDIMVHDVQNSNTYKFLKEVVEFFELPENVLQITMDKYNKLFQEGTKFYKEKCVSILCDVCLSLHNRRLCKDTYTRVFGLNAEKLVITKETTKENDYISVIHDLGNHCLLSKKDVLLMLRNVERLQNIMRTPSAVCCGLLLYLVRCKKIRLVDIKIERLSKIYGLHVNTIKLAEKDVKNHLKHYKC